MPGRSVSFKNVVLHLTRIMKIESRRSRRLLDDITELVFAKSQQNVPVDTGALKSSGRIIKRENAAIGTGRVYMANSIEYGGKSGIGPTRNAPDGIVDYAAIVHDLHKPFLTLAVMDAEDEIKRRVRKRQQQIVTNIVRVLGD